MYKNNFDYPFNSYKFSNYHFSRFRDYMPNTNFTLENNKICVYYPNKEYTENYENNIEENYCEYISSRGILKSCDIFSSKPTSSIKNLINYDFSKIKDNSVIYICTDAMLDFIKNILPNLKNKIIIVSGDCDTSITNKDFDDVINNDKIIHWFSQNLEKKHIKMSQIPIGLDYHTLFNNKNHSWGENLSPLKQEEILKSIIRNSKPFYERKKIAYANFHFFYKNSKYGYDRSDALKKLPKNIVYYEPEKIKRNDTWKKQSEYAFVISPHGNGLDCHRTWEALVLGCIPIVKKSVLDPLYDNLPVLIVNDWDEVNNNLLENTIKNFRNKKFIYEKLKLKYWVDLINKKKI